MFIEKTTNLKMFKFDLCILKAPFFLNLTCSVAAFVVRSSTVFCTDFPLFVIQFIHRDFCFLFNLYLLHKNREMTEP